MFRFLKQKIVDWCIDKQSVSIGDLHNSLNPSVCEIYNEENGNLKFIEQTRPNDVLVETPTGYSPIKHTHKTVRYDVWKIQTQSHSLKCADEHVVINESNQLVFVKDLNVGDWIKTKSGIEQITSIDQTSNQEHMFDLELDDENHVYYTNGILSHNSTVAGAFLLWYAIFGFDKTVLIASRANDHAMEMVSRIKFAYENLPHWLKPGVRDDEWNKHSLGFDNGSRIMSTATSENAGRGFSISLLYLDEFAFVAPNIQDEFWTSISPTLATGGSCIMTSTPNGDADIFAEIWRGANIPSSDPNKETGHNGFYPIRVYWDQPPGRDEAFKEDQIAKIGERRWLQEYACVVPDTLVDVMSPDGKIHTMTIEQLYHILHADSNQQQ